MGNPGSAANAPGCGQPKTQANEMNINTGRGFEARLPNKKEIQSIRNRFKSIIRKWRTQKLKVIYAYLNALVYRACRRMGVLDRVRQSRTGKKGFHRFIGDVKAVALKGISGFNITIEGIANQIKKLWGIVISETSLRKYRYELQDTFDLFNFESEPFPLGCKGNVNARRPPMLKQFDLPLACILLELLEDVLVKERDTSIEEFPGYGAMTRFIYNAVFRENEPESEDDETPVSPAYRRKKPQLDPIIMYHGSITVRASEMDWNDNQLNEKGMATWLGFDVNLIPDENGVFPELID